MKLDLSAWIRAGTRGFSLEVRILEEILIEVFCNDIGRKSFALHAPGFFWVKDNIGFVQAAEVGPAVMEVERKFRMFCRVSSQNFLKKTDRSHQVPGWHSSSCRGGKGWLPRG